MHPQPSSAGRIADQGIGAPHHGAAVWAKGDEYCGDGAAKAAPSKPDPGFARLGYGSPM